MNYIEGAFASADLGIPVGLLYTGKKGGGNELEWQNKATTDKGELQRLIAEHPDKQNYFMVAKAVLGGYLFLDDDGGIRAEYENVHGKLLPTRKHESPNGGSHYIYKHSAASLAYQRTINLGTIKELKPVGKGELWSLRMHDAYVIGPGSTFVNDQGETREYKLAFDAPIIEIPDTLLKFLGDRYEASKKKTSNGDFSEGIIITEGGRNTTLHKLASSMRGKGFDLEEILPTILSYNQRRCQPPLSDSEVATICNSACKYPEGAPDLVTIGGKYAGAASNAPVAETEEQKIARIEASIDTTLIERPVFPNWILEGTTINENLVKPAIENSGKQIALVFMPAFVALMNYLYGRVFLAEEEVNLNQFLGLISPAGDFHKSTCCGLAFQYLDAAGLLTFADNTNPDGKVILTKPGSSEGMGKLLYKLNAKHAIVYYPELQNMVAKAGIENSSLSSDLLLWAESDPYKNTVKATKDCYSFQAKSYCFTWIWNTTERGFPGQWATICGRASGLADRTMFVLSEEKQRQGANKKVNLSGALETRKAVDAALQIGTYHYDNPQDAANRLIGLNNNKRSEARAKAFSLAFAVELKLPYIDADCVDRGIALANYAWKMQQYMAPVEAMNQQGRLQKTILRELRRHAGKMTYRELCRELDYLSYANTWDYALKFLYEHDEIVEWQKKSRHGLPTHFVGIPKPKEED